MGIKDRCALLARLAAEPSESEWIEFKHNHASPDDIGKYISALSNSVMLAERERGYLVFGVENNTRKLLGTKMTLAEKKKGGENLINWLSRMIEPRIHMEFLDFECKGKSFAVIIIEPTYDRPVEFKSEPYIRIGENTKKLRDYPQKMRAIWLATGKRRFEDGVAYSHASEKDVFDLLDVEAYYTLTERPKERTKAQRIETIIKAGALLKNIEGSYDILNLGAILLAKDITKFPSVSNKAARVVKYSGTNRRKSEFEKQGVRGYAVGFAGMMKFTMRHLDLGQERIVDGVRITKMLPPVAVEEVVANALVHQDFTAIGVGPLVEIFDNRVEVSNPGSPLIDTERMIDERKSRNEKLASAMRELGICEERGGGLDKTLLELEAYGLPAPYFLPSKEGLRVVMFCETDFRKLNKGDRINICFYHCVIRWIEHDYMSNSSLRERFGLSKKQYQTATAVINDTIKAGKIAPADTSQAKRSAKYVPKFAS